MSVARPAGAGKKSAAGVASSASRRRATSAPTPAVAPAAPDVAETPVVAQPPAPEPPAVTYPVTLVLANDGASGDSQYVLDLTEPEILRLLSDDETPRYVRLPKLYSQHVPGVETRWVRMSNIAEIHIARWNPPAGLEWYGPAAGSTPIPTPPPGAQARL